MTDPNEPAFVRRQIPKKKPGPDDSAYEHGITKREYFAAMAMQGAMADLKSIKSIVPEGKYKSLGHYIAVQSCDMADALIAELNKETK